ncbi:hypothetical protein B0O79_1358 [Flavobacteriaceae bacterium MAR_2009_75]|nr:hypothetical protein B0O79_1358 [Flavobacteriaceae bacterium MAR_2009_75]
MENTKKRDWRDKLELLFIELIAAEKVYGTLVQSDRHPHKRPYFKHRHFQYGTFANILNDEFLAITERRPTENRTGENDLIFQPLEQSLLTQSTSKEDIDAQILKVERIMILRYQEILTHGELPNTTNAILQSQAEELNNEWQMLKSNLRIDFHDHENSIEV